MALNRRQTLIGAAATVAVAALPAVGAGVESETIFPAPRSFILRFSSTQEFIDFIAAGTDVRDIEWEFV